MTWTCSRPEEGRGVEPPPLSTARLSKPVAHHWALPSTVGLAGFEPATSRPRTERSTNLSHNPPPVLLPARPERRTGIVGTDGLEPPASGPPNRRPTNWATSRNAPPRGLEPPQHSFVGCCSVQFELRGYTGPGRTAHRVAGLMPSGPGSLVGDRGVEPRHTDLSDRPRHRLSRRLGGWELACGTLPASLASSTRVPGVQA